MAWTERQADAISSRGETLLVSAAAGSGKTSVLVERVMGLILDDRVSLDRMLIVTFTNAAAAEMKEKIGRRIRAALQQEGLAPEDRRFLRHQLSIMGSCNISTFHSFAIEVIRRYYHVIGVQPDLAVCDDARAELFKQEAMDELFEERFSSGDPELRYFLDCYATSRRDDEARKMIEDFYTFLRSLPEPSEWTKALCEGKLLESEDLAAIIKEKIRKSLSFAASLFEKAAAALTEGPERVGLAPALLMADKNRADAGKLRALLDELDSAPFEDILSRLSDISYERMSAAKAEKPSWEHMKSEVTALREAAKEVTGLLKGFSGCSAELLEREKEASLPVLKILCSLTEDYERRYSQKKLSRGLMDFPDMEHMALKILKNEQVSAEYRQRFSCVFIDEYQDSNMVQESLISRVAPKDGVFMVGDVKQSIYKFRQAEPELFLARYKDIKAGKREGRVIDLNANFRSKAAVIGLVNRLFSRIMNPGSCGILYDEDAALYEGAPYTGPLQYEPGLYLAQAKKEDAPAEEDEGRGAAGEELRELKAVELEALQAVDIIRAKLGKPIFDSREQRERPLRYRDMALLLPVVKNRGEVFYKTLSAAGIPVYLARTEGYFDTLEVGIFMDLLRIIDNSRNDVALISVLHFPAFGFSADELARIRIFSNERDRGLGKRKKRPFSSALGLYAAEGGDGALKLRCEDFLEKLALWKKKAAFEPLGSFVWELLSASGIMDCCSALPGGLQRQANLRALADKAQSFEEESASGLYGFITRVDAIREKVSVGEAEIFSEDSDAVRIMSIHKSKGLEFPFVLVCGMTEPLEKGGRNASKLAVHKGLGAAAVLVDPKTGMRNKPSIYRLLKEKDRGEERAERIRLLYVAATRAKDMLYFCAAGRDLWNKWERLGLSSAGDGYYEKDFLSLLYPVFGSGPNVFFSEQSALAAARDAGREELRKGLEQGFAVDESRLPIGPGEIEKRLDFKVPRAEKTGMSKLSVSQLAELARMEEGAPVFSDLSESFRPPAFMAPGKKPGAAARGTAYHTVMEHLPFRKDGHSPEEVRQFMRRLVASSILTQAEYESVDPGRISAFFSSPIGKRVLASSEVMKEAPFTVKRLYEGRELLVQGTLDCCFIEDGSWVLIDYKSNYVDPGAEEAEFERLRKEYLPQLAEYRYALETVTGIPVKEAVLYLFGPGKEIPVR